MPDTEFGAQHRKINFDKWLSIPRKDMIHISGNFVSNTGVLSR